MNEAVSKGVTRISDFFAEFAQSRRFGKRGLVNEILTLQILITAIIGALGNCRTLLGRAMGTQGQLQPLGDAMDRRAQ